MKKIFEKYSNKKISVFVVMFFFTWLNFSNFSFAQNQKDDLNFFQDRDGDGLADQEEATLGTDPDNSDTDGDGYGDGVEVKGGFDPLVAAPGDRIEKTEKTEGVEEVDKVDKVNETDDTNKTDDTDDTDDTKKVDKANLTDLFMDNIKKSKEKELDVLKEASLSDEGVIKVDDENKDVSLTNDDMEGIIDETLKEDGSSNKDMEMIDENEFTILDPPEDKDADVAIQEEKKQVEEYFIEVGYILTENYNYVSGDQDALSGDLTGLINEIGLDLDQGDDSTVNEMKKDGEDVFKQLKEVKVPYVLKDIHVTAMSLFQHLLKQDQSLAFSGDDPVGLNLLVGQLEGATMEADNLNEQVKQVLDKYNIDTIDAKDYQGQVGSDSFF